MASREEEKRQRREQREAQQRAAESANRRKRLVAIGGAVAAAIAVIVVGVVLAAGGGGDDASQASSSADGAPIPAQKEQDFDAAIKAAGCTFTEHPDEGSTHTQDRFTGYKTNPPTSGTHNPEPAPDGIYEPGESPEANNWVHTLEHGRVIIQYKPGTPQRQIDQLETLAGENVKGSPAYHMVLMENNTEMKPQVAAVTWTRSLTCDEMSDKTFDAIRVFRDRYVDQAPEFVP